jgi:hypothetical protein
MAAISVTVNGIVVKIRDLIQDSSYTSATDVISTMNQLYLELGGGVRIIDKAGVSRMTPPLPGLLTSATTHTSATYAYVSMPTDFQRGPQSVYDSSGNKIPVKEWSEFIKGNTLLDKAGAVTKACVTGNSRLYYQGIPVTSETLTMYYWKEPTALAYTAGTATPSVITAIPNHLKEPLFVNGVCARIYNEIEDGTEGNKTNTIFYESQFQKNLLDLESSIPADGESFYI